MSLKTLDNKGRWRNVTVAFRMSQKESEQLNIKVGLSGLTKQDYLINRSLEKEIVVNGNPRVFKALRNQMADIQSQLNMIAKNSSPSNELLETIQLVVVTMNGLNK